MHTRGHSPCYTVAMDLPIQPLTPKERAEVERRWVIDKMKHLAENADSESVRMAALSKLGDEYGAFQSKAAVAVAESLEALLTGIRRQPIAIDTPPPALPPPATI